MAVSRYGDVTADFSPDRTIVVVTSDPHDLDLTLTTKGARELWFALGRLFFNSNPRESHPTDRRPHLSEPS